MTSSSNEQSLNFYEFSQQFDNQFPLQDSNLRTVPDPSASADACTFCFINDTQLDVNSPQDLLNSQAVVTWLNQVENIKWPDGLSCSGQAIGQLDFVTIQGDLTQWGGYPNIWGNSEFFNKFRVIFERGRSSESLKWPLRVGLGNHDESPDGPLGPLDRDLYRNFMWDYVRALHKGTKLAKAIEPVTNIDADLQDQFVYLASGSFKVIHADWKEHSFNYSVDYPTLHAVHLHKYGGDNQYGRAGGLQWLVQDLAQIDTNKNVIIFQHYGWTDFAFDSNWDTSWTHEESELLLSLIDTYNIVAIIHGHDHASINPYLVNDEIYAYNPGAVTSAGNNPATGRCLGLARVSATTFDCVYGVIDQNGDMIWGTPKSYPIATDNKPVQYSQLVQVATLTALDATANLKDNAYLNTQNDGPYQKWNFIPIKGSDGLFLVVHQATGFFLDAGHDNQVYLHAYNGGPYQKWKPTPIPGSDDRFFIDHPATGLRLDGNAIGETYLHDPNNGNFQQWWLRPTLNI